tara:strand:+ start:383 stop:574 length:192 start_codon:yes stop_codon:yes gene_type:complete
MKFMIVLLGILAAPAALAHHEPYFSLSDTENIAFLLMMAGILFSTASLVFQRVKVTNKKSNYS